MEDVIVFANAIAGLGRGKAIASQLADALGAAGLGVRLFFDPPATIPAEQLPNPANTRAVIAIGGDGTLRNVTQRLMDTLGPGNIPPILVVPLGTANLMAHHLHLDWGESPSAASIVEAIQHRKTVQLDAARANGQLFLVTAGVGMDGHIIHELDRVRSGPIDLTSYAFPLALAMQKFTYPSVTVEVDGQHMFGPQPGMVFIANAPEYGTGFSILPDARSNDGLLDICVLPCKNRGQFFDLALAAASGEHLKLEDAQYRRGVRMSVRAEEPIPLQIDGEAGGFTPLEVELLPVRVPFIVS